MQVKTTTTTTITFSEKELLLLHDIIDNVDVQGSDLHADFIQEIVDKI